ncbi:MAG: hypothetical protein HN849_09265 [Victivallales bacterium]|nr:hypothetical protein [Victivallales bacterium]MBT7163560.1 hypothetical protein [Victivallales bacterium]MBT7299691.1 hypothetical protein [Victivallales bacterium]
MSRIEVSYSLTQEQFMAAVEASWKAQGVSTRFCVLIGLAVVLVAGASMPFASWLGWPLLWLGAVLLAVAAIRTRVWRRAFQAARKYTQSIHVVFTDENIHVDSAEGTSDLNWTFYSAYRDIPDYVLLYMTRHAFSAIPKSAFDNEEDLRTVLRLADAELEWAGAKWRCRGFLR